jgi:hypothetical protein
LRDNSALTHPRVRTASGSDSIKAQLGWLT